MRGGIKRKFKQENSDDDSASENELDGLSDSMDEDEKNNHSDNDSNDIDTEKNIEQERKKLKLKHTDSKNKLKSAKVAHMKEKCNEDSSIFVKCRYFSKLDPLEFKKLFTDKGFDVKAVYKQPPLSQFGFIDLGSSEAVKRAIKQFHTTKIQGQIVIASNMKPKQVTQEERVSKEASLPPITLVDRIIYIRNVPFMTSKKNLQDIFTKAETILIPPCRGNALRDALVIFPSNAHLESALELTQGCEYKGHKLLVERMNTIPIVSHTNGPVKNKIKKNKSPEVKKNKSPEVKKIKKSNKLNKTK